MERKGNRAMKRKIGEDGIKMERERKMRIAREREWESLLHWKSTIYIKLPHHTLYREIFIFERKTKWYWWYYIYTFRSLLICSTDRYSAIFLVGKFSKLPSSTIDIFTNVLEKFTPVSAMTSEVYHQAESKYHYSNSNLSLTLRDQPTNIKNQLNYIGHHSPSMPRKNIWKPEKQSKKENKYVLCDSYDDTCNINFLWRRFERKIPSIFLSRNLK